MHKGLMSAVAVGALMVGGAAYAQDDTITIGVLVSLEGTYAVPGEDGVRGFEMALNEFGHEAGGRQIEYIIESTDTTPDTAVRQARKLTEQDEVDFIIGPLSGSEGIAIRDYAKEVPETTIINGISGAQETTWVDPAPNFFRFNLDGAQWGYGLGSYVIEEKGWERIATVAEDYSFAYTNFLGFAMDFCNAGGEITERFWVPLGSSDFASVIASLPQDVDALYLGLGGSDAVNFLNQYQQAGGDANLIGGTIMVGDAVNWPWEMRIGYSPNREFTDALSLTLNMMSANDEASVIASPQVMAQDGREAEVRVTTEEWFQITSEVGTFLRADLREIETGTILGITPRIGPKGKLTLDLNIEVSDVVARGAENLPVVSRRTARSTVEIENGGTAAVAGLVDTRAQSGSDGVPGLRNVPLLGHAFRTDTLTHQARQVAVFITATIVGEDGKETFAGKGGYKGKGNPAPPVVEVDEAVYRAELEAALDRLEGAGMAGAAE